MAVNNDVKNAFAKYLKNVKITIEKPDAREPDFLFYDGYNGVLNIYRWAYNRSLTRLQTILSLTYSFFLVPNTALSRPYSIYSLHLW